MSDYDGKILAAHEFFGDQGKYYRITYLGLTVSTGKYTEYSAPASVYIVRYGKDKAREYAREYDPSFNLFKYQILF